VLGDDVEWGLTDHLLAQLIDAVNEGNWQRQGKPHAPRPKPVKRPGVEDKTQTFGKDPIPISQFDDWWHGRG
jgi:hypothetical protein